MLLSDTTQLDKLRQLGLTSEDELKLEALRDHILKLTVARQSSSRETPPLQLLGNVALQNYGVTPQTIFWNTSAVASKEKIQSPQLARLESGTFRRMSMDTIVSSRAGSPALVHRNFSDTSAVDDLRRRLALAAGPSSSSVNTLSAEHETADTRLPTVPDMPSPSPESNLSIPPQTVNVLSEEALKARNRIDSRGVSVHRVSPALGKDVTPAIGQINVESKYRLDDEATSAFSAPSVRPGGPTFGSQKLSTTYGQLFFMAREHR
jgi:phosphoinositide-3-kinase regulatory subunit 4